MHQRYLHEPAYASPSPTIAPVRMIGCFESSASPSDRRANAGSHSLRTPLQREHNTARRFRRAAWPTTTEVIGARAVAGGTRNTHSSDQTAFRLCG